MSSENHQEIEVLRGRLAECQEQLSRVKEEDKEKERVINGWRILGKTARKKIDELERRSRGYDAWKGLANRRKDEMEAVQRRLTREANDREGERAQVEQIMRETIEQELREKMEQDLRTGIGDERKCLIEHTELNPSSFILIS